LPPLWLRIALKHSHTKKRVQHALGLWSESPYCNNLRKLAEDLNVTDQLEIAPPVPIEEIPSFLEQADIGIYTAMPDSHMEIAIPGKIIEYAMMGIPIIASRFNILEQYFPENAILFFEPGNLSNSVNKCQIITYPET
jgi:glycosyltransferase involved in cell wall biosynthesis